MQLLGDGTDVVHLWDRDCSLQRHRQKIVEVAPATAVPLPHGLRAAVLDAAVRIGRHVGYAGVARWLDGQPTSSVARNLGPAIVFALIMVSLNFVFGLYRRPERLSLTTYVARLILAMFDVSN